MEYVTLEPIDWAIVEALARAPRVAFSRLAAALGVSDQTVARRYQRLRERAGFRVVACLASACSGTTEWFLRLKCSPDLSAGVGKALVARQDTKWVRLVSGGTEVTCSLSAPVGGTALIERLAAGPRLVDIRAHAILHQFSPRLWPRLSGHLTASQLAAIEEDIVANEVTGAPCGLDDLDGEMLAVLSYDGRAPVAELAAATGLHESSARRRLEQLVQSGQVVFEVDLDPHAVGAGMFALLWLSVLPTELDNVGQALAADQHVPFAAATSGPTNLLATVLAADGEELYQFLTHQLGGWRGVQHVEAAPIMKVLKRHGQPAPQKAAARRAGFAPSGPSRRTLSRAPGKQRELTPARRLVPRGEHSSAL